MNQPGPTAFFCFCAGLLTLGLSCAPSGGSDPVRLAYTVHVAPESGIEVELRVSGLGGKDPGFQLLSGLGMIQDQPGHIREVYARTTDGLPLDLDREPETERTVWRLRGKHKDEVVLRYRVTPYDPGISAEASFVSRDQALLLGYSAFLVPVELSDFLPASIRVKVEAPPGWRVWTSWPGEDGYYRPRTTHDLWSGGILSGNFQETRLTSGAVSVTVLTEGRWSSVTGLTVANRLHPVLRRMVDFFGAPPEGDNLDVLAVYRAAPVRDNQSRIMGISEANAFFCIATHDRFDDMREITALAAHECIHFYLGGALVARPEAPYNNAPDLVWLIEGVTEYLAYRFMLEAEGITAAEFEDVAEAKRTLLRRKGEESGMSLAAMARLFDDPETYQLVYSRGFLVAQFLNRRMDSRCGEGTFDGALRDLFETWNFHRTHEWIDQKRVRKVFEARCPGAWEWIERYAIGGAALPGPARPASK